jgi:hypothetical protein
VTVDTRLGPLAFDHSYPAKDTVATLYDALDFQRATQAYLWGLPLVSMAEWQHVTEQTFGVKNGDLVVYRTYRDKLELLAANNTTPYTVSFVSLTPTGPLVFELPAGPNAGVVDDMWQRPIEDLGQTGPDNMKGGTFLILGPGQSDPREPAATHPGSDQYILPHSPTNNVCFFLRSLDPDPHKAQQWTERIRLYPYSQRANPPTIKILTPGGKPGSQRQPRGMAYWEQLAAIINQEPVQERDRIMMGMLKPLGIEKGHPFEPDARQKTLLEDAAFVGEAMAKTITFAKRFDDARYRPDTQWGYGWSGAGLYRHQHGQRRPLAGRGKHL